MLVVIIIITSNISYKEYNMKNYSKTNVGSEPRTELHDILSLTGAEISFNNLPQGAGVPFIHSHKENEEIYIILSGTGKAVIDGEEISLKEGDCVRISPKAKRQFTASPDSPLSYICIQVKAGSLGNYSASDAVIIQ